MSSTSVPVDSPPPDLVRLPAAPVLLAGPGRAVWIDLEGEVHSLSGREAATRARQRPPLVCHARAVARRLDCDPFPALDLLELFAFIRPASFCPPTPHGLASALGLAKPADAEAAAGLLPQAAVALLRELAARGGRDRDAPGIAWTMAQAGWLWGPFVIAALGFGEGGAVLPKRNLGLRVWERLPEWEERPPRGAPGTQPVLPEEGRARLAAVLAGLMTGEAEPRPQQADYAAAATAAFAPRAVEGEPQVVLAEAGTGTGKTLGYLAAASLWAERNNAAAWISTYTRNLQGQVDDELAALFPEPRERAARVVIRKGRENYLCLLNLAEAVSQLPARPQDAVALGLMARWAARTRNGDMVGGDFPGWFTDLFGPVRTLGLADRRGECIYSACQHYRKCFIERSVRSARQADIVVANHALVMIQAAMGGGDDGQLPTRYVFDEGHHLFEAADSAFAAHLSGRESRELRRWLLGAEGGRRGATRLRGLKRRLEDLLADDAAALEALEEVLRAGRVLAGEGWRQRIEEGRAEGASEQFLTLAARQVYARSSGQDQPYSLEAPAQPPVDGLAEAADALAAGLAGLIQPLKALRRLLLARLDEDAETLDSDSRRRIEAAAGGLEGRALLPLAAWQDMLRALKDETPPEFCDWFAVERLDGRDIDVGLYRHWIDPSRPFAASLGQSAHGLLITSATLTDQNLAPSALNDAEAERDLKAEAWQAAERRLGIDHMAAAVSRLSLASPFDYAAQTRVLIVHDLKRGDLDQLAAAYRSLLLAAGGGALGLFTAIARLRAVQKRIAPALAEAGVALYSQHVDGLDTGTLVDIFRAEEDSCLLGTDAVRDGVDVPGRSLRLIAFDRVPWPRPDIIHKARRAAFGGRAYDEQLTRLKLRQAYGRLIRRADDRGVFVLLDPLPSRLLDAFPPAVTAQRVGLAEAVAQVTEFLDR
ncbi:ATP-dependent DNA helicase [Pelagibius litoralis]|uniref:ATP-dependent DNA helicase n=1 Tax=Pelagibius litoralis TaxID=374515 RepID=A0A967KDR9_9PROT|nr:ATP-dependent DNA helicase [Pelagibius litoralis]NIA71564.1 ATP-dependent DNA helicase [Pelagibius litoralis]